MNKEELVNLNMKDVILDKWKSKLSYPLNHKDIEELENIIDYYDGQNQKYKEVIDKAREYINNNGERQYNHHDNYRGKWYSPDELDTLVNILKEVE